MRCILRVAAHRDRRPLSVPEIARLEGLGPEYVGLLMQKLRAAGLVHSVRGAAGGYRLARAADQISVWEVVTALGGEFLPEHFCRCRSAQRRSCARLGDCSIRALWQRLKANLRSELQAVRLTDLQRDETSMAAWLSSRPSGSTACGVS